MSDVLERAAEVHYLHDPANDPADCRECAIITAHVIRWQEARECYGSDTAIPWPVQTELNEALRQAWIDQTNMDGTREPKFRHDKTIRMRSFVVENVGKRVTPTEIMLAADATISTANAFIRDNRSMFRKVLPGVYMVVDVAAERAADKVPPPPPTMPAPARVGAPAPTTADHDAATVAATLAAMTGQAVPAPRPVDVPTSTAPARRPLGLPGKP